MHEKVGHEATGRHVLTPPLRDIEGQQLLC